MEESEVIAQRQLVFVSPDGEETRTFIQFGKPYESERHGTCCDYEIPSIEKRRFGAGVDGIQAILLTMSMVESILEKRRSEGWSFLWPDTREKTTPQEIFHADHFAALRSRTDE